jgi:hypothetical protein
MILGKMVSTALGCSIYKRVRMEISTIVRRKVDDLILVSAWKNPPTIFKYYGDR